MSHSAKAKEFLQNEEFANWQDRALWFVREKRDIASKKLKEWEYLREVANNIKSHTISYLDKYLEEFEKNAKKNGFIVHWAVDDKEFNKIIYDILKSKGVKSVVKSKSMLTEECGLNKYLEKKGIEVIDTDLGERIIQLRNERPSHIVLPAIHLKKEQVSDTFSKYLGAKRGNFDPKYLTKVARDHLRDKFLSADAAITGVNFAISENGSFVVCTNEGNADMGVNMTNLHIAVMGIEKIIPKVSHLSIFIRLLARSATGQTITTYTSHFCKPRPNSKTHIVIVDNKRTDILKNKSQKESLCCIRCGACLNSCPVYRRSGGHSYSYVIPGPIGSVLASNKDLKGYGDLLQACSLCKSCDNVCPVKIPLSNQLIHKRAEQVKAKQQPFSKILLFKIMSYILSNHILNDMFFKLLKYMPKKIVYSKYNLWTKGRKMPTFAKESFKDIYKKIKDEQR